MSDDIVDHLQYRANITRWGDAASQNENIADVMAMLNARAEIIRLRAEVERLTAEMHKQHDDAIHWLSAHDRWHALADQLAEALRCTYGLDMTHMDRVSAHNMAVRALAAYEAAHKETT